jgi:Signal transduction histidine kinase
MSEETMAHIFDRFYQGDASHSTEGNGLGLALVKKAVSLIRGEISVDSRLNEGASFVVKIKI